MSVTDIRHAQETIDEAVLDAVRRGFRNVSDLVSFCGPELVDVSDDGTERELDTPQILRAIDRLIERGHLEREGERFAARLRVRITDAGRQVAPPLSDTEETVISEVGVAPEALAVLSHVVTFEARQDVLPSISQLRKETELGFITYQIQPLYVQLAEAGLARTRGLFRLKVEPTDRGRQLVDEYDPLIREIIDEQ